MSVPASAIGGQADLRLSAEVNVIGSYADRVIHNLHDPNVTIEEYLHYASISRSEERRLYGPGTGPDNGGSRLGRILAGKLSEKEKPELSSEQSTAPSSREGPIKDEVVEMAAVSGHGPDDAPSHGAVGNEEWLQASRATRTATWGAIFYLITTDILGPSSVPWAMSQLGYGPGVTLYTVFGALAG